VRYGVLGMPLARGETPWRRMGSVDDWPLASSEAAAAGERRARRTPFQADGARPGHSSWGLHASHPPRGACAAEEALGK
jgi:hypothetical protein